MKTSWNFLRCKFHCRYQIFPLPPIPSHTSGPPFAKMSICQTKGFKNPFLASKDESEPKNCILRRFAKHTLSHFSGKQDLVKSIYHISPPKRNGIWNRPSIITLSNQRERRTNQRWINIKQSSISLKQDFHSPNIWHRELKQYCFTRQTLVFGSSNNIVSRPKQYCFIRESPIFGT